MTAVLYVVTLVAVAAVGGLIGSIMGLGGGIIIVPFLTLVLGVPMRMALGASLVSIIATSSGAASSYVADRLTNLRVGMFLELGTTLGAVTGALLVGIMPTRALYILFGALLGQSAYSLYQRRRQELPAPVQPDRWSERLALRGEYYDQALHQRVTYRATGCWPALATMYGAGIASGLLGIGSGVFKVLAMDGIMHLPMKVSTATSNFMIGVTAAASAGVYLARGDINPLLAGPVALGVLLGARVGAHLMTRLRNTVIRKAFIPILLYTAAEMLLKGMRG
ncbi:MAG TPA: sulfite exporter TauE/SafE family protein [Firmicutes bacterium]|nr:sulfite exporter TauE/SafE family protein [Bacillota bacterium]